jgi:hypothetical protein
MRGSETSRITAGCRTSRLASTIRLRERGFSVVPIDPVDGKKPLCPWKRYQSTRATLQELRTWFETRWPEANVGVVTGAVSRVVVLDVDGDEGRESLRQQGGVPLTPISITGRGMHIWFAHPGRMVANFAGRVPGLDLRGDGGYVVAPPSLHASGSEYYWEIAPWEATLAQMPGWLDDLVGGSVQGSIRDPLRLCGDIPKGRRNDSLFRLARSCRARGLSEPGTLAALNVENETRCRPALSQHEVRSLVSHAYRLPDRGDFTIHPAVSVDDLILRGLGR